MGLRLVAAVAFKQDHEYGLEDYEVDDEVDDEVDEVEEDEVDDEVEEDESGDMDDSPVVYPHQFDNLGGMIVCRKCGRTSTESRTGSSVISCEFK